MCWHKPELLRTYLFLPDYDALLTHIQKYSTHFLQCDRDSWHHAINRNVPAKNKSKRTTVQYSATENHSGQKWRITTYCQNQRLYFLDLPSFSTFWSKEQVARVLNHLDSYFCPDRVRFYVRRGAPLFSSYNCQWLKKNYCRWRVPMRNVQYCNRYVLCMYVTLCT